MNVLFKISEIRQNFKYRKAHLGVNSRIGVGTIISNPKNLYIGENSYINGGTFAIGENSKIIIGNDCLISYNVHFRTMTHFYENKDVVIRKQGEYEKSIIVEDDVWVGYGAQIMPGITLHKGCVIGAGAVVTHDVNEYEVVGGVPAKHIKNRV